MIDIKETNDLWMDDFKELIKKLSTQAENEIKRNGDNALNTITRVKTKIIESVKIKGYSDIEIIFSNKVVKDPGQNRLGVLSVGGIIMIDNNGKNEPVTIAGSKSLERLLKIGQALRIL
ncbi:MAG TPA: hypothetical protein VMZ91_07600 [Candidatus Paceibacterota bacterium]|nr:hypothetical protein [Candidatus Paceibacterota bacterium]